MSSTSISLSSFEDDRRNRRSRSRTRRDVKKSKNRVRRHSSSLESSDEFPPRVKKRKGSKRKDDSCVSKKSFGKKKKRKSKRYTSVSLRSSGGGSSTDESDEEWSRGKSKRKDKDRRSHKVKRESRSRSLSRFRLSHGRCSSDEEEREKQEEESYNVVNSRRLKSVITVRDEPKEEIVYDHDDYPPSRSNDSNDGGSTRELPDDSPPGSETRRKERDEEGEDTDDGSEGRYDGSDFARDGFRMNDDAVKDGENEDSGAVDISKDRDLELILRQKALENLKKFKKGGGDGVVDPSEVVKSNVNPDSSDGNKECWPNKLDVVKSPNRVTQVDDSEKQVNKLMLVELAPKQESSDTMEEPQGNCMIDDSKVDNSNIETAETAIPAGGSNNYSFNSDETSCSVPAAVGGSLNESSQFQKKTMTVMRGGEMVEVSILIYRSLSTIIFKPLAATLSHNIWILCFTC